MALKAGPLRGEGRPAGEGKGRVPGHRKTRM